ncbi:hypothetical protein OAD66_02625 [Bacteroidia bacterium]|nr:hypothetical protein [Bacteroidia bacterium]
MTNYYKYKIDSGIDTFSQFEAGVNFKFASTTISSEIKFEEGDLIIGVKSPSSIYVLRVDNYTSNEISLTKQIEVDSDFQINFENNRIIKKIDLQEYEGILKNILIEFVDTNSASSIPETINMLEEFTDWFIKHDGSKHNYFKDSFNSNRVKLIVGLSEYEDVYNEEFKSLVFSLPKDNLQEHIKILEKNLYREEGKFFEYSQKKSTHMPRAILGKSNYLKFLKDRIENPKINSKFDIENIKVEFADWLFQQSKYLRVYKSDKAVLIEKLSEYEQAYENDFGIAIFDIPNLSIESIIGELESNIIDETGQIGDLNKRTVGNGSVKAILGPNNYIKFLKELLKQEKVSSENIQFTTPQIDFNISSFQNACKNAGLVYTDQLITRFVSSLLTKPFVILTGLSGSGKTKLAQAYVQWICQEESQYRIIPVGADWTNREPLLGYPNALNPEEYVKPDSGVIDLVLQANSNPELPHFLILDEMNLSHVERYFADFLSVMESNEEIPLYSEGTMDNGVPSKLKVPANLFIIGTVNIDETTYMFSPKVLDRANTIEFRLTEKDLEDFIASEVKLDMDVLKAQGANMGQSFMSMALLETYKNLKPVADDLKLFFSELKKSGAEFGYRTASEIGRLMYMLVELGEEGENLLDIAIMQKLLPKLHGSRNKLTKVLPILGGFCLTDKSNIKEEYLDKYLNNNLSEAEIKSNINVRYKISFEKICRMYKNAVENGFASYAEA